MVSKPGISLVAIHHDFELVTGGVTLQYLEPIGFGYVTRLMADEVLGAGTAGRAVGNDSSSLFSSECKRLLCITLVEQAGLKRARLVAG
jgi:hypothetical protein